ncbi:MAG: hypothetical protein M3340_12655 [Actinomycetota bacterium]|nr:hypothetical protein [Actinomycetota bacterium]
MTSSAERRGRYFRTNLRSRGSFWGLFIGIAGSLVVAAAMHDVRVAAAGPAVTVLLVVLVAYRGAATQAESEFFRELAPALGLNYTVGGSYVPITPLLAGGDRQRFEHTMEGPLYGRAGGPPCLLGHFSYDTRHEHEDITVWKPHPFTVCAVDSGAPLVRFRGLYLRRRLSGLGLEHDWLDRAPKPQRVELESARFNELYDLRRTSDQDELALRELFSPSFVVWLSEHPLSPGFECKAGTLVVFIPGHEGSAGKLTLLHEAAREIARRLAKQVEQDAHFSAAGQTIR